MGVGLCALARSGMHNLFAFDSVQSGEGVGNEFLYIIGAVIGGCLLTGGYGSAIGGALGALIFGMANKGIVYAEWNPDWFKFFLGPHAAARHDRQPVVRKRVERSVTTVSTRHADGHHTAAPLVELEGVGKRYGNIIALRERRPRPSTPAASPACWATTAPASPP